MVVRSAAADLGPEEEQDFDALTNKVSDLVKEMNDDLRGCSIYLVGMMGSGKSTLGKMLANTLRYAFFDTDTMIEMTHEKTPVSDIFSKYGEEYFRNCETEVLKQLAPYKNLIISTGGGAVIRPTNWSYMHNGIVCWLNGDPELLARRVVKDGPEKRPLLQQDGMTGDNAVAKTTERLAKLLEERRKYYENADLVVPLVGYGQDAEGGAPAAVIMYRLLTQLKDRIEEKKREREDKKNFRVERTTQLPNMTVVQTPVSSINRVEDETAAPEQ